MTEKLKVTNIIFTNELNIDDLINDYANFIANKLFNERGVVYDKEEKSNINVDLIIKEIKEHLSTGKEMTYVKSLNLNESYKEKEIKKAIIQSKKQKLKKFIKKLLIG